MPLFGWGKRAERPALLTEPYLKMHFDVYGQPEDRGKQFRILLPCIEVRIEGIDQRLGETWRKLALFSWLILLKQEMQGYPEVIRQEVVTGLAPAMDLYLRSKLLAPQRPRSGRHVGSMTVEVRSEVVEGRKPPLVLVKNNNFGRYGDMAGTSLVLGDGLETMLAVLGEKVAPLLIAELTVGLWKWGVLGQSDGPWNFDMTDWSVGYLESFDRTLDEFEEVLRSLRAPT